jgi:hypothetical protein
MPRRRLGPSGPFSLDSVANLAGLAALGASRAGAGDIVWVTSLRRPFVKDTGGGAAVPGQVVTCTDGSGVWRSMSPFSGDAGAWRTQTDWHIDAANGTVEGDGSAAHPIDSWRELLARLAGQQLQPSTSITLHTGLSETIDVSQLVPDTTTPLVVSGTPTTVATDEVAAYATTSTAGAGEAPILTATAIADWTPYVGLHRVRFLDGPAAGAVTAPLKVNPAGGGLQTVRVNRPGTIVLPIPAYPSPAVGNAFVVETVPNVAGIIGPNATSSLQREAVQIMSVGLPDAPDFNYITGNTLALAGCVFGPTEFRVGSLRVASCNLGYGAFPRVDFYGGLVYCYAAGLWGPFFTGPFSQLVECVAQLGVGYFGGTHYYDNLLAFDNPAGAGVTVGYSGTFLRGHHRLMGYGSSTYGVNVAAALAGLGYDATKPQVTGATNDVRVNATVTNWAGVAAALNSVGAGVVAG